MPSTQRRFLTASSPEGARDFLVPSPQSIPASSMPCRRAPQQYKQLLMVAGFDRYFQIARRASATKTRAPTACRSSEFYQLDLEMSFVTQEDGLGHDGAGWI